MNHCHDNVSHQQKCCQTCRIKTLWLVGIPKRKGSSHWPVNRCTGKLSPNRQCIYANNCNFNQRRHLIILLFCTQTCKAHAFRYTSLQQLMAELCAIKTAHVREEATLCQSKSKGPGQVGLYELPTTISKRTQNYIFVFII